MKKFLNAKSDRLIFIFVAAILGFYFLFSALIKLKSILAPLVTAVILAIIIIPFAKWLEKRLSRTWSSFLSSFLIFLGSLVLVGIVVLQLNNFTDSWPQIKENMKPKLEEAKNYAVENLPFKQSDFKDIDSQLKNSSTFSASQTGKKVSSFLMKVLGFLGNYLLTFIYIFFVLRYRHLFKKFLLKTTKKSRQDNVERILSDSVKVATQYLQGKFILIGLLAVVYSIGLGVSGVNNFILVSIIAALLTLIPYLGNLIGLGMALAFGYLTTADTTTLIGILLTFSISQVLESYVLQPYIVGDKVDVNPFFVILSVILGSFIWGVVGMVLAIPVTAIIVVILKHIPELKPIGILLSTDNFDQSD